MALRELQNLGGKCIRVLIAESNPVTQRVLQLFVSSCGDLQLIGTATDGLEAVHRCGRLRPDVVLMDLEIPVLDGIAATYLIRQRWPQTQVVLLSMRAAGSELADEAREAGAFACVSKFNLDEDLIRVIRSAANPVAAPISDLPKIRGVSQFRGAAFR